MIEEIKLYCCPFCGARALHYGVDKNGYLAAPYSEYRIRCSNDDCPVGPSTYGKTFAEAAKKWNTRYAWVDIPDKEAFIRFLKDTEDYLWSVEVTASDSLCLLSSFIQSMGEKLKRREND